MRQSGIEPREDFCVCNVVAAVLRYENPNFSITACYLEQEEFHICFKFDVISDSAWMSCFGILPMEGIL